MADLRAAIDARARVVRTSCVAAAALLAVALGATGAVAANAQARHATSESLAIEGRAYSYVSAPSLHPAQVNVDVSRRGKAGGLLFLDPFASSPKPLVGEEGPQILQSDGQPVWTHTAGKGEAALDFEAQTYRGKPVLTWWQGNVAVPPRFTNLPEGSPEPGARYFVYNDRYKRIKTVYAREGWTADLHEFKITPRNTALFIAYKTVPMNLTAYGGSAQGAVEDAEIQEVSLSTGKLLFKWDMLEHVPLGESEVAAPLSGIWDPYHLNSLQEVAGGRLVLSARNTWAIYEIDKASGATLWQLGGRRSSFSIAPGASFYWQHDAHLENGDQLTMFDDGCCNLLPTGLAPPEQYAHGLVVKLDFANHTASAVQSYAHDPSLHVPSQGDLQRLPNGNVLVGWGQLPYLSEYTSSGRLVYAATLPEADESYRALRFAWTGHPATKPSLVATRAGAKTKLFMSWNGATQVRRWAILAGSSKGQL
ncbi:MAG: arylsulfotransferase family protein, partial [Solirubrobacteraceae bacterium]